MGQMQVIEVNGERYVSVADMLRAIAVIRETSKSRKIALEYIVKNLKECGETKLRGTIRVTS